jgi:UDP-N-acetylglucosamine 1-carboxyvinyltransferase
VNNVNGGLWLYVDADVIAACCAEGKSVIDNAQMIDRGYEAIDERLRALGADIVRES